MDKFRNCLLLAVTFSLLTVNTSAKTLVREFTGSRSTNTADFEVKGPWILDWRVAGDFPHMLAIDVAMEDADTGVHQGRVLKTKWVGSGVRLFKEGGHFRFRVTSALARWTLKVEEISEQEAELYTPKRNKPPEDSEQPGSIKLEER